MKVRNKVKAKMANTFKKIIKKHKKKKLQAERNRKAKARERAEEEYADDYERRLSPVSYTHLRFGKLLCLQASENWTIL